MINKRQQHWDEKWSHRRADERPSVCRLLAAYQAQLAGERALDVACGLGQNAIWLAQHGFDVDALDISPVALARAQAEAEQCGAQVNFVWADLDQIAGQGPGSLSFGRFTQYDVIVVRRFLNRCLWPALRQALAPGGWLFYETYNLRKHIVQRDFPDAFLLQDGELLRVFGDWRVVECGDEGGQHKEISWIVARKP